MSKATKIALSLSGAWLILNLLQAAFTGLGDDEAYYWMYSRFMDWGYFDHPPMTPGLIRMGYGVFQKEFGVRIFFVLMNTASLFLLWRLTDRKAPWLFFGILFSTFLVHAGFMSAPDVPLMFFAVVFFSLLKKYLERDSWGLAAALGVVMALLLYSKFHSILLVPFSLLAFPAFFRRPSFYLIPLISILLLLPLILWQIDHGMATLNYYLYERPASEYSFSNTTDFLLGLIFIAGPLMGFLSLPAAFRLKSSGPFQRILRFNLFGILGFFFLFTFRGHIETNWLAQILIPLVLLSYAYLEPRISRLSVRRVVFALAIPSFLFFLLLRIQLAFSVFPMEMIRLSEYQNLNAYALQVDSLAAGRPILANSYQKASKLSFYTGQMVPSLKTGGRSSQYDIWRLEREHERKEVVWLAGLKRRCSQAFHYPGNAHYYSLVNPYFVSYDGVEVRPMTDTLVVPAGKVVNVKVRVNGLRDIHHEEATLQGQPTWLRYHLLKGEETIVWYGLATDILPETNRLKVQEMKVLTPNEPGLYGFIPELYSQNFCWWGAVKKYWLQVEPR